MTESAGRTPHPDDPAEGGTESPDQQGGGQTPHPEEPAEGADTDEQPGVDPGNRVTGV